VENCHRRRGRRSGTRAGTRRRPSRVSRMQSASRVIGTQASVESPCSPGEATAPRTTVVAAFHSFERSSGALAQRNALPPCSRASASIIRACSATPAAVPWNSKNSVGFGSKPSSFEYPNARAHLHVVESSDRAATECRAASRGSPSDRPAEVRELAHRRRDRLGHTVEAAAAPRVIDTERAFLAG